LNLTLEELYSGTTKRLKIKRRSQTLQRDDETVLEVKVKPGWKAGTKVTFPNEGDEVAPGRAQDVIFVVQETPHSKFAREGSNLLYHSSMLLVDALAASHDEPVKIDVPTLDNRILRVNVRDIVTPTYTKIVKGEGMPSSKEPGVKGDLVITFDVVFPKKLDEGAKRRLVEVLPRS